MQSTMGIAYEWGCLCSGQECPSFNYSCCCVHFLSETDYVVHFIFVHVLSLWVESNVIRTGTLPSFGWDHLQSGWQLNTTKTIEGGEEEPDDDASLYRLFGFSLFAGVCFTKKMLYDQLNTVTLPVPGGVSAWTGGNEKPSGSINQYVLQLLSSKTVVRWWYSEHWLPCYASAFKQSRDTSIVGNSCGKGEVWLRLQSKRCWKMQSCWVTSRHVSHHVLTLLILPLSHEYT